MYCSGKMLLNVAFKVDFRRNNAYFTPILHGNSEFTPTTEGCRIKSSDIQKFTFRPKMGIAVLKK